jgi:nucleoside-diphosphate kinase
MKVLCSLLVLIVMVVLANSVVVDVQADGSSEVIVNATLCSGAFNEESLVLIKPDGVQRRLVGEIIQRFERKGLQLMDLKMVQSPSRTIVETHYEEHRQRKFFNDVVEYMTSGPVVAMAWAGDNCIQTIRNMIGSTNPSKAQPGTIRGDYAIDVGRNLIHASDSIESASREIAIWFESSTRCWNDTMRAWIYE